MRLVSWIAIGAACCLAQATLGGGKANELKLLEGKWIPVTAELAGQPFPDEVLKTMSLKIAGGKYTVVVGDKTDQGKFEINAAKKPKTMDIIGTDGANNGQTFLAIYEVERNLLRVCYDLGGKLRPTEFTTKAGTQQFLVKYKRTK